MTMKQTFKEYLKEVRYYKQKEDWQADINQHGLSYGICPRCGGEAGITTTGGTLATARRYWECEDEACGHKGPEERY